MDEFCFMIQPFDRGKFDKRYEDVFKAAIEETGLEAYRVDNDDLATVPIDMIEKKLKQQLYVLRILPWITQMFGMKLVMQWQVIRQQY